MWNTGILDSGHGREWRLGGRCLFEATQRHVGNGQGSKGDSLMEGRRVSSRGCFFFDSSFQRSDLILHVLLLLLLTALVLLSRSSFRLPRHGRPIGSDFLSQKATKNEWRKKG
jgi:hypothetical protein